MLNLEALCNAYHIPYRTSGHHHCHQGWAQTHCPRCGTGRDGWHLGFNLERGNFHCWRCGSIRVVDVVKLLLHTDDMGTIRDTIEKYQAVGTRVAKSETRLRKTAEPPIGCGPMTRQHRNYLRSRGFRPRELEREYGLLGTQHLSGTWNWRVIIPIRDATGNKVAYQGRSIRPDAKPRYRMTDVHQMSADPRTLLYGIERIDNAVVIVEGVPGVWRIGRGAVATFGIDWKQQQADQLRRCARRYVLFDPEPTAQRRADELAGYLSLFGGITEVISGFDVDPGELTATQVRRLRRRLGL